MGNLGLSIARPALVEALESHSFVAQDVGRDLYMVRKSEVTGVYERIEFEVAGRRDEVIVVGLAIAVVWNVVNQMRGLVQPGGLPEVCPNPYSAKVQLMSVQEAQLWAARVGAIAPDRASALAREHGPALLQKTEVARTPATQAFRTLVEPATDLRSLSDDASSEQRLIIDNALSRPYVIPSQELRPVAVAAVAALVRMGDPDVIELGRDTGSPTQDPRVRLDQLLSVPHLAIWKVRILIDMMCRDLQ